LAEEKRKAAGASRLPAEPRKADEGASEAEEQRDAEGDARQLEAQRTAEEALRLAEEQRQTEAKRKAEDAARLAKQRLQAEGERRTTEARLLQQRRVLDLIKVWNAEVQGCNEDPQLIRRLFDNEFQERALQLRDALVEVGGEALIHRGCYLHPYDVYEIELIWNELEHMARR